PGDAEAVRQYATQYMKQRRWNDALSNLPRAGRSAPLDLVLLRLEAATYQAMEEGGNELSQRLESLLTEVDEIRKSNPDRADAAMVQALILVSQGHPEAAETQLQSAIKKAKDPLRLELQLARIYATTGRAGDPSHQRWDDAIATARTACKNHSEAVAAWQ